jgi:hypothetical protein
MCRFVGIYQMFSKGSGGGGGGGDAEISITTTTIMVQQMSFSNYLIKIQRSKNRYFRHCLCLHPWGKMGRSLLNWVHLTKMIFIHRHKTNANR